MSAFGKKLRHWAGDGKEGYFFWCPGCNESHMVQTSPSGWGFNGNGDAPTFTPSVLVTYKYRSEESRERAVAFRREHGRPMTLDELPYDRKDVCHSYVTDGRIQFLTDCTHALAGQIVDLPDYPSNVD